MADVLAEAGFCVTTAANGRAALVSWGEARAQVVVTDVQMPVMNGCELFAALRSIDEMLPVIVLTADDLEYTASLFPGAFRIIRKPVPTDAVVSAVTDALLDQRRPRRRRVANAARAILSYGHAKGHAAMSQTTSLLLLRTKAERPVVRKRKRAGLAMAGLGAAAAVAVLIAAIRGLVV